jgi:hypothetical protein
MKNMAASVRARLLNHSRSSGESFNDLLEQYATGRFLWRLSESAYRERFILKGAQLFRLWSSELHRPTRDLDLLGYGDSSEAALASVLNEICQAPIAPQDGLVWGEVATAPIRKELDYGGTRALLAADLAGARIPLQIDIGFGDAITPAPKEAEWAGMLDFPVARLLAYPPETVIAEKIEAAVNLGIGNSRMKDFFDLLWLRNHQQFSSATLGAAIGATFARRGTDMPSGIPFALTPEFGEDPDKNLQWNSFVRKGKLKAPPFAEVIADITNFLSPFFKSDGHPESSTWTPENGWTETLS